MEHCYKFHADPTHDPINGNPIKPNGPIYKKWVNMCGHSPAWAFSQAQFKVNSNLEEGCGFSYIGRAGEDRLIKITFNNVRIYAVFDGHGGSAVVNAVVEKLPKRLYQALQNIDLQHQAVFVQAVQKVFMDLDKEILQHLWLNSSGCTATLAVIIPNRVYIINLGDSRTILFDQHKILLQSRDHSPTFEDEYSRIRSLGGCIISSRVGGILAVSRAFGDYELKCTAQSKNYDCMGWVSALPDIYAYEMPADATDLHLLLASDGLWDAMSSHQAVDLVNRSNYNCHDLIAEAKKHTTDDITVIVVDV